MTFHLGSWSRGALLPGEAAEAQALLAGRGFSRLLVLHGSALERDGAVVVVVGPRGIGKSSACRALVRRGRGSLLEDGLLVVGEVEGRWCLVETGTVAVLRRAALLKSGPRRLLPAATGPVRPSERRSESLRSRLHRVLDLQAFRAGVLFSRRRPAGPPGQLRLVDRIVVAGEPASPSGSFETDGRTMSAILDLDAFIPAGCEVRRVATSGSRREVVARLVAAMRG